MPFTDSGGKLFGIHTRGNIYNSYQLTKLRIYTLTYPTISATFTPSLAPSPTPRPGNSSTIPLFVSLQAGSANPLALQSLIIRWVPVPNISTIPPNETDPSNIRITKYQYMVFF